jgi:soluble lytic murein transglycosylase-like protein
MAEATRKSTSPSATVEEALAFLKVSQLRLLGGLFAAADGEEQPLINFSVREPLSLFTTPPQYSADGAAADRPALRRPQLIGREKIEEMIEQIAGTVELAPELIRSVVAVESSYNPTAVSPAGARGLMQLMPATAAELGVKDSFDPQENLAAGSRYLSRLLHKYAGDLDHALAAYNWGQGNVDRQGLERMPEETRNYLARVKALLAQSNDATTSRAVGRG